MSFSGPRRSSDLIYSLHIGHGGRQAGTLGPTTPMAVKVSNSRVDRYTNNKVLTFSFPCHFSHHHHVSLSHLGRKNEGKKKKERVRHGSLSVYFRYSRNVHSLILVQVDALQQQQKNVPHVRR